MGEGASEEANASLQASSSGLDMLTLEAASKDLIGPDSNEIVFLFK